jgi:hypothetical protein
MSRTVLLLIVQELSEEGATSGSDVRASEGPVFVISSKALNAIVWETTRTGDTEVLSLSVSEPKSFSGYPVGTVGSNAHEFLP